LYHARAQVENEEIYRVEFPEKAGSLRMFLDAMNDEYDISLFHYRTAGTFTGQVLVGLALPNDRKADFEKVVQGLGWSFTCETNNIAATLFL
jgi:threonine dehydratase